MQRCDVLIVGGGPAGSSCAWALRNSGLDVVVMDKMAFPRDKVCAGWITPAVIEELNLDMEIYRQQHVFQPITGFRVGLIGGPMHEIPYDHAVSYAIRRFEFDDYLLRRSGARLRLGEPLKNLARTGEGWLVNGSLQADVIVGAGGHFCPVARFLGADVGRTELAVNAQECEFEIKVPERHSYPMEAGIPELYFCDDLKGYGWCVRKGDFINIGLGREENLGIAQHVTAFQRFLMKNARIPSDLELRFKGHAYLLYRHARRRLVDDGVLLIGDAAGLAYTQSGEGIRPAVESGLMAAATILQAKEYYSRDALEAYTRRLTSRLGTRTHDWSDMLPMFVKSRLSGKLLASRWFVQHLLLDCWFLHADEPHLRSS